MKVCQQVSVASDARPPTHAQYRGIIAGVSVAIACDSDACQAAADELALYFDRRPAGPAPGPDGADLHVELFDGPLPAEPQAPLSFSHGLVRAFHSPAGICLRSPSCDVRLTPREGGMRCVLDMRGLEHLDRTVHVTLFIGLALILRERGLYHLHAASLRTTDGRGLLVVGDGGAGKTTLALALKRSGMTLLGDDACWLQLVEREIIAHPAQRPIQASAETIAALPGADTLPRRKIVGSEKYRVSLPRARGAISPRWLLFPHIVDRPRSELARLDSAAAFGPLLRASALLLADGASGPAENIRALGALLDQSQSMTLAAGRDVLDANDALVWARTLRA